MPYTIEDFKTGQDISSPAKIELWNQIIKRSFGGLDCAYSQYEKYEASGIWMSYHINGMIMYLDELTGGHYGKKHTNIKTISGTLATQFKKKFTSIHYLMSNSNNSILDRQFNIAPVKEKEIKTHSPKNTNSINHSKVYAALAEIHSKNFSIDEIKFIGNNLLNL
jgi:hypothetical protein